MNLKKIPLPDGAKIFQVHHLTYLYKGATYHLEIDEFPDGSFTGHGEHSTDKSSVLASVTATSAEDCVLQLIKKVKGN